MKIWRVLRTSAGIVLVIVGTISIALSVVAAGTVAGIDNTVGRAGVVSQSVGAVTSDPGQVAVIADGVVAQWERPQDPEWVLTLLSLVGTSPDEFIETVGDFIFVVTPTTDSAAFVGVASSDAVNAYLDGSPYAVAVRDGQEWPTISVPGDERPARAPLDETFWSASAQGSPAELPAEALDGSTMVLMRADSGDGVVVTLRLEYRVPQATSTMETAAITASASAVGGLLAILLGAFAIVGRKPRGRHA